MRTLARTVAGWIAGTAVAWLIYAALAVSTGLVLYYWRWTLAVVLWAICLGSIFFDGPREPKQPDQHA
jgi:hypothetical protein